MVKLRLELCGPDLQLRTHSTAQNFLLILLPSEYSQEKNIKIAKCYKGDGGIPSCPKSLPQAPLPCYKCVSHTLAVDK